MAVFVSDEFGLDSGLEELGVFDSLMDEDSNFFINIKRLRDTKVPEFRGSYNNINSYFRDLGILLKVSKEPGDKFYKTAIKKFDFPEVRGINLGFSKGTRGAGFGPILSNQIIKDAFVFGNRKVQLLEIKNTITGTVYFISSKNSSYDSFCL